MSQRRGNRRKKAISEPLAKPAKAGVLGGAIPLQKSTIHSCYIVLIDTTLSIKQLNHLKSGTELSNRWLNKNKKTMSALGSFLGSAQGQATIQGSSNLLGGFVNWAAAAQQNKKQRKWQKEMADYAYQKDVDMWNMSNEYNTPANQMARFTEAGLNPALIYGQGTPGNATQSPAKYQDVKGQFGLPGLDIPNVLGMYQDIKIKKAQEDSIRAGIERTKEQTKLLGLKILLDNMEAGFKPSQIAHLLKKMSFTESMWPDQAEGAKLKNEQTKAQIISSLSSANLSNAQRKKIEYFMNRLEETGISENAPWWIQFMNFFATQFGGHGPDWEPGPATIPPNQK